MFRGAAGEALNTAEHPFNNSSALRASNWTSQFEENLNCPPGASAPVRFRIFGAILFLFIGRCHMPKAKLNGCLPVRPSEEQTAKSALVP
jgi:hypothetical protein